MVYCVALMLACSAIIKADRSYSLGLIRIILHISPVVVMVGASRPPSWTLPRLVRLDG